VAKTDFKSVDEYIRAQPTGVRPVLWRVRRIIRKAVPEAVEFISYQLPAYRLAEGPVRCFAAWKQHYSLYPASDEARGGLQGRAHAVQSQQGYTALPALGASTRQTDRARRKFRAKEAERRAKAKRALEKQGR
jgi:Domain of unknown function (DU1801)